MLGIDNLKPALVGTAKLFMDIREKAKDGLTASEGISIAIGNSATLLAFAEFKEIVNEARDLDATEAQELRDAFAAEFDLENDQVEEKIEATLAFLLHAGVYIEILTDKGEENLPE